MVVDAVRSEPVSGIWAAKFPVKQGLIGAGYAGQAGLTFLRSVYIVLGLGLDVAVIKT